MMFHIRKRAKSGGTLIVILCLISSTLPGQVAGGGQAVQQEPVTTIKATTRMVQVSVVVQDRNHQPVPDLTKDDFVLLDKDQPQTIAIFSREASAKAAVAPPPQLPDGIYANRLQMKGHVPGSVTVVLFDTLNTRLEDQSFARSQVFKFFEKLEPQDHVAIYALTGKLEVLHDFTQDVGALVEAINRYRGTASGQLDASTAPPGDMNRVAPQLPSGAGTAGANQLQAIQQLFQNAEQRQQDMAVVNRANVTMAAIEAIAYHLAPVPGRKNLVWVSGSFPLAVGAEGPDQKNPTQEVRTFGERLERTTRALNQANLAVYPVDARGLMGPVSYSATEPPKGELFKQAPETKVERDTGDFAAMDEMANETGGRSFHNNNDLFAVVRTAMADGEMSYQLGFYPSHGRWDGKYHEIKVKVKRPGLNLHYRKGYFATPDAADTESERKAEIDAAVNSPIEATNLSILAQLYAPEKETPDQFGLGVMLNAKEIEFRETAAGKHCVLDFVFVQRDAAGKQLSGEEKRAEFTPDQKKYESLLQTGMLVTHHLKLMRGVAQLKIVVRDALSRSIGSVVVPIVMRTAAKPSS